MAVGLLADFKRTLDESPGRILWQQTQDSFLRLQRLPEHVFEAAIAGYVRRISAIEMEMDNWTSQGRIKVANELQKQARKTLDLNVAEGYALWLAGAWLEAAERPGQEARQTHIALDGLAKAYLGRS